MSNLDDLGYTSIIDMDVSEAIDLLRQIRLKRRISEKRVVSQRKVTKSKVDASIDPALAAQLLKLLGGNSE